MRSGSFSDVYEGNAEILGGNRKEEIPLSHHGEIKWAAKEQYWKEVANFAIITHHEVGNRSYELGADTVICVSRRRRTVVGIDFSEKGRREAEDALFI